MQGYDDITGFRKATGVSNYKILSKYNSDNILKKWSVLERIHGAAVAGAIYPQMPGLTEFQDVPPWNINSPEEAVQQQVDFNITPPPRIENRLTAVESSTAQVYPKDLLTNDTNNTTTVELKNSKRFSSLFSQKTPASDSAVPSNQQRDVQLKMLFERITSCQ